MTTFMTPVNERFNPLPTRVIYRWADDRNYRELTDRAQNTLMSMEENPSDPRVQESVFLYGFAPPGVPPPPRSDRSWGVDTFKDGTVKCGEIANEHVKLGLQRPWWASEPEAHGAIHACIEDNPVLGPGNEIVVISELFPPIPQYPQGRYLWTWYAPFPGSKGRRARPVTFMESASNIEEGGTDLALADYFDYREFSQQLPASCFTLPDCCSESA
jgi:hypothetical protein